MDKTCLDCGKIIPRGYRCKQHTTLLNKVRNALPRRQAYRDPVYRSYVKDNKCAECGSIIDLTKDHRQSLIKGGNNDYDNLQTLCRSCNSTKKGSNTIGSGT